MYTLILLLMTVLIFKILFSSFGFLPSGEEEKKDEAVNCFVKKIKDETIIQNKDNAKNNSISILKKFYNSYKSKIKNVKNSTEPVKKEKTKEELLVEDEIFKKTAKKAVTIILDAFTGKNFKALEDMLTKEMYDIFSKNIKEAEEKKYNYRTVIVSFDKVDIIEKQFTYDEKLIKLSFKMRQINYVENESGELVSGSKDKIDVVDECWTFIKKSDSQFWLLKSIN